MRAVNVKKLNYKDQVARRHRQIFILRIIGTIVGTIVIVTGLVHFLFFSMIFDVREVGFNGLDTMSSDEFQLKINDQLNQKILKYLPRRNNILFVNTGNLETELTSAYPIFKSVNVQKKLPHALVLEFLERKPVGIWCFGSTPLTTSCSYFDQDKVLWGQPAKSSGFIFLTVEDQRKTEDRRRVDNHFFKPIMEVARNMSGEIRNIVIPEKSFNEFRVYTVDYYIIFTTDSDIQSQLDVLKIFMNDKIKDSPPADGFHPQYIDLRIDGRVYYK